VQGTGDLPVTRARCRGRTSQIGTCDHYCSVVTDLDDYLELTVSQAREQFRDLLARPPVAGKRIVFTPVETLLCIAASLVVKHRSYGGANIHRVPEPVPSLGRLFSRSPSSVLEKMRNIDGVRPNGGKWDVLAGAILRADTARLSRMYRMLLHAARAEGIGADRLPDFLGLEDGGEFALLGQEEIDDSVLEAELRDRLAGRDLGEKWTLQETERVLKAAARVGQHLFARTVMVNCGGRCVFCGLKPDVFGGKRMLVASHIKPWRDSTASERLDPRNGLAACPAHDIAFDTGLLTVNGGLRVHLARPLADAVQADPVTRHYYGHPPLQPSLLLPAGAPAPRRKYLDWHRQNIFVA
jgi:putative restriction endonuclease